MQNKKRKSQPLTQGKKVVEIWKLKEKKNQKTSKKNTGKYLYDSKWQIFSTGQKLIIVKLNWIPS